MKSFLVKTVFALLIFVQAASADEVISGGLGSGEHRPYKIDEWSGSEQLITRLKKPSDVYEFVRVSRDAFEIRLGSGKSEVLFRFNRLFNDGGSIWNEAKLIDIFRDKDHVSALMYGERGYYLVAASAKSPLLEKGEFYAQPKLLQVENWYLVSSVHSRDYYGDREVRYPLSSKIGSVKLLGPNVIEFTYRQADGKDLAPDVFSFKGNQLLKNGREDGEVVIWRLKTDEEELIRYLKMIESDEDLRKMLLNTFTTKEDFLSYVSNYRVKKNYDEIKERVEKAFGNITPDDSSPAPDRGH